MFSFKKRKKQQDVRGLICRLVDQSTPRFHHKEEDARQETRHNRTLPILVVPFDDEELDISSVAFAVSKDLSSKGTAILSQEPIESQSVVIGFWNESRCEFIRGNVRYRRPTAGGFWQIGVEFMELMARGDHPRLLELSHMADRLTVTSDDQMQSVRVTAG